MTAGNAWWKAYANDLASLACGPEGLVAYVAIAGALSRGQSSEARWTDGSAMTPDDLAESIGLPAHAQFVAEGIRKLERSRRVTRSEDGAFTIAGWGSSQRSSAAEKQKRYRDRLRQRDVTRYALPDIQIPPPDLDPQPPAAKLDGVLGEAVDAVAKRKPRAKRGARQPPQLDVRAAVVVQRIADRRAALGMRPLPTSQITDRHIVARLDEGVSLDDLLLAVDLRYAEAQGDETSAGYLDCSAPFTGPHAGRPGGWSVSRRMLDSHHLAQSKRTAKPRGESTDSMRERLRADDDFIPSLQPWETDDDFGGDDSA